MLAQAKMRKYWNLFFRYFLCFSILHFRRPPGHFWASAGWRSCSGMLKTSNKKCRNLEDLSRNSDGLWFWARSRKLWLLQVDVFFNIDFCSFFIVVQIYFVINYMWTLHFHFQGIVMTLGIHHTCINSIFEWNGSLLACKSSIVAF